MVACVFQSFYPDIIMNAKIINYVPRAGDIARSLSRGCLWPSLGASSDPVQDVIGAYCDVFSIDPNNPIGLGITSLNDWGNLAGFIARSDTYPPGYYNGKITGIMTTGPIALKNYFGYSYDIDPYSNSSFPGGAPNLNSVTTIGGGANPSMSTTTVNMPKYNVFAAYQTPVGTAREIRSDGIVTTPFIINGAGDYMGGRVPETAYVLVGNSISQNIQIGIIDDVTPAYSRFDVIWDNATINTHYHSGGVSLATEATISPLGYLDFIIGPVTIGTRTVSNFFILVSFDGTKYWIIPMVGGNANTATALAAAGGFRRGQITMPIRPTLWFRNSVSNTDKVYAGDFPIYNNPVSITGIIPVPLRPKLIF